MPDFHNPFQTIDIFVLQEHHYIYQKYCGHGLGSDNSPFPRMIDLWFLSLCVAARKSLPPTDLSSPQTVKIIDGSILSQDPWRIHAIMLISIHVKGDTQIVSDPRAMMTLVSGLSASGIPVLNDMLTDSAAQPIWNISESIDALLKC